MSRRVYNSTEELYSSVENPTPLVRINRLNAHRETFQLYAKLEWYNPSGSIKDRAAKSMLDEIESGATFRSGSATRPLRLVEPTSGNTGIALAALAAARGHQVRVVVPAKVPLEKKALLRLAGADVDVINDQLCPAPGLGEGAINLATTYSRAQGYAMPNQYENAANIRAHETTTGPEIWHQTAGRITHLFAALGTCGTITGLARYLKRQNPAVKIVAVQPTPGHDVPGLRNTSELAVSKLFDPSLIDETLEIDHRLAYSRAADLFRREGLRAGPSSGLIFEGASRVIAREAAAGRTGHAVAIFCDDAFKYSSSFTKHLPELKEFT
jgi:cysteine synthase